MPSPWASVEARAVMIETWAQPLPEDATACAGAAASALSARTPAALATTPAPNRRSLLVEGRMHCSSERKSQRETRRSHRGLSMHTLRHLPGASVESPLCYKRVSRNADSLRRPCYLSTYRHISNFPSIIHSGLIR